MVLCGVIVVSFKREKMVRKRTVIQYLSVVGSLLIGGCSTTALHLYDGPEQPIEQLATVKTWNPHVNIVAVDGKSAGMIGRADRVYLLPGEHTFTLYSVLGSTWRPGYSSSTTAKGELRFRTEAGHAYVIRVTPDNDRVLYSSEDKGTHYDGQCFNPRLPPEMHVKLGCY